MTRLKIRRDSEELFDQLLQRGYVISDGKATRPITYAFKKAGIDIYNGYDQNTRKVILAMEQRINVIPKAKTLKFNIFDVER